MGFKALSLGEIAGGSLERSLFHRSVAVPAAKVPKKLSSNARKLLDPLRIERISSIQPYSETHNLVLLNDAEKARELPFFRENELSIIDHTINLDYDYWTSNQILHAIVPAGLDVPSGFESAGHIAHLNLGPEYSADLKRMIAQVLLDKNKTIRTVVNKTSKIHHTYRFFSMELLGGEDDMMVKDLRESSCYFSFDYSKVYWNSRLQYEHNRLITTYISPGDTVCDAMAGVGPFALPAARVSLAALVLANDLNPDSMAALSANVSRNKLDGRVKVYNICAREFMRNVSLRQLNSDAVWRGVLQSERKIQAAKSAKQGKRGKKKQSGQGAPNENDNAAQSGQGAPNENDKRTATSERREPFNITPGSPPRDIKTETFRTFDHYIMNLPETAIDFLGTALIFLTPVDVFKGLYTRFMPHPRPAKAPLVHVYAFAVSPAKPGAGVDVLDVPRKDLLRRCSERIGYDLIKCKDDVPVVHHVRSVAPNKDMYCVTFRVPMEVLYSEDVSDTTLEASRNAKRVKTSEE